MLWGTISYQDKVDSDGIERRVDSKYIINVLESILRVANTVLGEDWILQQGNAVVHGFQ